MEGQKKWLPTMKQVIPILRYAGPLGNPECVYDHATKPPLPLINPPAAQSQHTVPISSVPDPIFLGNSDVKHVENVDGPEHKFQINEQLIYEHEFHGKCYVSAHLQRLQHGIFSDSNIHGKGTIFKTAVIEITAQEIDKEPLRFVKFAPHLAFGRISTETLKWNFQLSATLGVTKGPASFSVNPSIGRQTEKVLGTMMKIQGSTRSLCVSEHLKQRRVPDAKLVWSLEENDQQETGLPREFTFVFLIERHPKVIHAGKNVSKTHRNSQAQTIEKQAELDALHPRCFSHADIFTPIHIGIVVEPDISNIADLPSLKGETFSIKKVCDIEQAIGRQPNTLIEDQVGQRLLAEHTHDTSCTNGEHTVINGYYNFAKMPGNFEDLVELPGNAVTTVVRTTFMQVCSGENIRTHS